MFRKDAYNHYFYEDLRISSDYGFIIKCFLKKNVRVSYLNFKFTKMLNGGISNSGFKKSFLSFKEDKIIIERLKLGNFLTIIFKRIRKIKQV